MNPPSARPRPWAPFFIALSAMLNVLVIGAWHDVKVAGAAIGILSAAAAAVLLLDRLLFRNLAKTTVATTLIMVWFCTFGAVHDMLVGLEGKVFPFASVRLRLTMGLSLAALGLALVWIGRSRRPLVRLHRALNLTGLLLVVFALPGLVRRSREYSALPALAPAARPATTTNRPDVLFLVLDSYTSSESLNTYWGFDNAPFERALRERGFQIVPEAHANYRSTPMTIASMFQMSYLPAPAESNLGDDPKSLVHVIQTSRVPEIFKSLGYRTVNLSLFDIGRTGRHYGFLFQNYFSLAGLMRHTAWFKFEYARKNLGLWREIADINLGIFSALSEMPLPDPRQPTFVYAHVMMPHPPFSFDHTGRRRGNYLPLDLAERQAAYLEQLRYVNELVLPTLDRILSRYRTRPVIILQGDHGYRFVPQPVGNEESFTILNAIALPPGLDAPIPPGLTPVNTFRFVFNTCFGTGYPLLENHRGTDSGPVSWRPLRTTF